MSKDDQRRQDRPRAPRRARRDERAGPPDAAGNAGAFGRPEDELTLPEPGDHRPPPDLQYMHVQHELDGGRPFTAAAIAVLVMVSVMAILYYLGITW